MPRNTISERDLKLTPVMAALAIVVSSSTSFGSEQIPRLGKPASVEHMTMWDLSIGQDGSNLPEGRGSVRQGEQLYNERCAACHGESGDNPRLPLAGGQGSLTDVVPQKTVGSFWPYATTLFDYTRRSMPYDSPKSLSNNEVYALVAYMLWLNDVLDEESVLDATSLAEIRMPNRDGFVSQWSHR